MHEYQVVLIRLTQVSADDELALTDLLNERERMGWSLVRLDGLAERRPRGGRLSA